MKIKKYINDINTVNRENDSRRVMLIICITVGLMVVAESALVMAVTQGWI